MKKIAFLALASLILATSCASSKHSSGDKTGKSDVAKAVADQPSKQVNFSDPVTWILGPFRIERLCRQPYSEWYLKGYDDYAFSPGVVEQLKTLMTVDIRIEIVMGTWCPDSRREVPSFMRVMDAAGFQSDKVELLGVDNSKVAPVKDYEALDIKRVPTFIVYKKNVELGRIIENPATSLEQDMVNILTRNENK